MFSTAVLPCWSAAIRSESLSPNVRGHEDKERGAGHDQPGARRKQQLDQRVAAFVTQAPAPASHVLGHPPESAKTALVPVAPLASGSVNGVIVVPLRFVFAICVAPDGSLPVFVLVELLAKQT
jgi:hypothetical protein